MRFSPSSIYVLQLYGNYDVWNKSAENITYEQWKAKTGGVVEEEVEGEMRIDPNDDGSCEFVLFLICLDSLTH